MIPADERNPCKPDIFAATYEPAESVPARHETPDVTELRRLYSEWQETVNPYGFRLMPSGEYYALAAAAVNALPALLDAAAERDRLAEAVERVRALHAPYYPLRDGRAYCGVCEGDEFVAYPCPTIRALAAETGGES